MSAQVASNQDFRAEEERYKTILKKDPGQNEKLLAEQEGSLIALGSLYRKEHKIQELADLIRNSRSVMSNFAKSKTAKVIRRLIDLFPVTPESLDTQITVIDECIDWAISEKRNFLRQNLQVRLVAAYYEKGRFQDALALINTLTRELKRLDDKMGLLEIQLLESKVYHSLRNLPKSKAALTSARTNANSVYTPSLVQAGLDLESGILHAEDNDYKTAYSYFQEALENFQTSLVHVNSRSRNQRPLTVFEEISNASAEAKATSVFKYMLLCKIMLNLSDDTQNLLNGKQAQKFAGRDIDAMKAVAAAHGNRSLKEFEDALENYRAELSADPVIRTHFSALYDTLLEQNLVKVIEPFSTVEISHVANVIGLDVRQVEGKLSQMILDKVFHGVLDQGNGWLIVFDEPKPDQTYEAALETIKHMSTVVDLLYDKAAKLD